MAPMRGTKEDCRCHSSLRTVLRAMEVADHRIAPQEANAAKVANGRFDAPTSQAVKNRTPGTK